MEEWPLNSVITAHNLLEKSSSKTLMGQISREISPNPPSGGSGYNLNYHIREREKERDPYEMMDETFEVSYFINDITRFFIYKNTSFFFGWCVGGVWGGGGESRGKALFLVGLNSLKYWVGSIFTYCWRVFEKFWMGKHTWLRPYT